MCLGISVHTTAGKEKMMFNLEVIWKSFIVGYMYKEYLPCFHYIWNFWVWLNRHHKQECLVTACGCSVSSLVYYYLFSAPEPKAQVHYCDHALSVVRPSLTFHIFDFFTETTEQNSTKLDRKQELNILYQVCVFRVDRKTRWPPWPLIVWDIFDFSSETVERNSTKLARNQDIIVLYHVCVFLADRKNKMAALASDWLRHFRLLWNRWTEFNETWQEARYRRLRPSLCF